MKTKKKHTYIDLFAGCGGLSLGLLNAGWKGIFAIEKSIDAFRTLEHNLVKKKQHFQWPKWLPLENHNIDHVLSRYRKELKKLEGTIDMVAGGPPCQGFSFAGRRKENDSRNKLVNSYIDFIHLVKPKIIFFENVKGFTLGFKDNNEEGKNYSAHVIYELDKLGYNVQGKLIDFSEFGIPQKRTRFILIGEKKNDSQERVVRSFFEIIQENKHKFLKQKNLSSTVSLEEAISDLLERHGVNKCPDSKNFRSGKYSTAKNSYQKYLRMGKRKGTVPDSHRLANHTQKIKDRFQYAIDNNLGPKDYKIHFKLSKNGTKKSLKDEAITTLTTLPDDHIHYQEPRIFTVREFARIQSFPDWFEFKGPYTTGGKLRVKQTPRYTQVGNAIPPLFGEQAGVALKEMVTR